MKNFFNAIGVADMEKVHSAMIAWILDDENDPSISSKTTIASSQFATFPIKCRSDLLCILFGLQPTKQFNSIKTYVEWNDIDIMIKTVDTQGAEDVWVIENKLKSQEHMSMVSAEEKNRWNTSTDTIWQTEKYEHIIDDYIIDNSYSNVTTHFTLLSLSGDKAKSPSSKWGSCTYSDLSNFLKGQNLSANVLIGEYSNSISRIIDELNNFLKTTKPCSYTHVFNKLKKSQKDLTQTQISQDERFIVENGLETIFQKQYLANNIVPLLSQFITSNVRYDERNGVAMFVVPICSIGDYELNIEFQGGTFKVGINHKDYLQRSSSQYTKFLYDPNSNVNKMFKRLSNNTWRIASAKNLQKGTAKPRISLDKNIAKRGKASSWFLAKSDVFINIYGEAHKIAKSIQSNIQTIP